MSDTFRPMGFDLSGSISAESSTETTTEDSEEITRFVPNEVIEGYILGGEWARVLEEIREIHDFERPSVSWGDNLRDYEAKVEENDYNDQQKLQLLGMLFKGTLGAKQSEENEGYGPGWNNDENPPKPYDNENTHYADVFRHLPAWEWEGLDGGEREVFESEGIDPSELGFDRTNEGPKLPVINGERVPIAVTEGDELQKALKMINTIDFDNLTYCEENGTLQNEPTMGSDGDTDKVPEKDTDDEVFNLAENPERVGEVNVTDLRGQGPEELSVANIDSLRTITTVLRAEKEGKNRSSAVSRIGERRNALMGNDEEETTESEDEDSLSEAEKDLMNTLLETGRAENIEEAKEKIRSL